MNPEIHFALLIARLQKNSPAVLRHLHVVKLRPSIWLDADRSAQVNLIIVALVRAHVVPPAHVRRLPVFQRPLQAAVPPQIHVVRNFLGVINHDDSPLRMVFILTSLRYYLFTSSSQTLSQLNFTGAPVP